MSEEYKKELETWLKELKEMQKSNIKHDAENIVTIKYVIDRIKYILESRLYNK